MKTATCAVLALFAFGIVPGAWAQLRVRGDSVRALAKERDKKDKDDKDKVSFVRCGGLYGRSGVALGPSAYCEVNPFPWFGAYPTVGKSQVDGYVTRGIVAGVRGLSAGVGVVMRPLHVGHFRFGAFAQATYSGDHIRASVPNPATGATDTVYESDRNPLVTIGPDIEWRIPHTELWVLVRPGKNFGDGLAAGTAGGFSINAGIITDPVHPASRAFRGLKKLF